MYLTQFGLHSRPFRLLPDTDRMVWTPSLKAVRERVIDAVENHVPLIVLTGAVGVGKTTFLTALLEDGIASTTQIAFLRGSTGGADEVLRFVAKALTLSTKHEGNALARIAEAARIEPLLVILDEAQGAAPDGVMELHRLAQGEGRLTLLLAGQPELRGRLDGSEYRGMNVAPDHQHVLALPDEDEAQIYIARRLEAAGGSGDLIRPDARAVIAHAAQRVPRKINKVADACLLMAAMDGRRDVDKAFARQVIENDLDPNTLGLSIGIRAGPLGDMGPGTDGDGDLTAMAGSEDRSPHPQETEPRDLTAITPADPLLDDTLSTPVLRDGAHDTGNRGGRPASWIAGAVMAISFGAILFVLFPGARIAPGTVLETLQSAMAPSDVPDVQEPAEVSGDPPTMSETGKQAGPEPVALSPAKVAKEVANALFAQALSRDDPSGSAIDYARAAVLGHDRSAVYIGQKYDTGDGVSFNSDMAARWYAVADGTDPAQVAFGEGPMNADPLRGTRIGERVDLVWDGFAPVFDVELADSDGTPIGTFRTTLTAASLLADEAAVAWRVRVEGEGSSDWMPIQSEEPQDLSAPDPR